MRKLFPLVFCLLVFSCTNQTKSSNANRSIDQSGITKGISIPEDMLIDLPFWDELTKQGSQANITQEQLALAKVAIYRFYQHVSIQDGYYVCDLASPSDIHVSGEIYDDLMNNLTEINALVKERRDKGVHIDLPEVTDDYLDSLLK